MANIKISQLPNVSQNLTSGALIPIVSTNGTYTTDKVSVSNLANFILNEAGNTLANASIANLTYNVVNASQPNITSLGTLSSLNVVGTANLGYLNDVVILGGNLGYVLSTDGTGNLSWSAQAGATGATGPIGATGPSGGPTGATGLVGATGATGIFGGSLTANLDANGFYISNAANITANYFVGTTTNVSVEAVNNAYSYHIVLTTGPGDSTLHIDGDDDLQYDPYDGILTVTRIDADYVLTDNLLHANNQPWVGNIAPLNLDGNVGNVLRGDGTWGTNSSASGDGGNATSSVLVLASLSGGNAFSA